MRMTEVPTESVGKKTRRRLYERSKTSEHPLTGLKLEVLRTVAASQYLSTPQVAALVNLSEKATRDHLRDLLDLDCLKVLSVPKVVLGQGQYGMAAKVHIPTKTGLETLWEMDLLPINPESRKVTRSPGYATLAHQLAVRDVLVWLTRSARQHQTAGHSVERWDCTGALAVGDTVPDAVFAYLYEPGEPGHRRVGLVEVDRGTERATSGGVNDKWAAKIAAYSAVFEEPKRGTLVSVTGFRRARIVVTVESEGRANWIARRVSGTPIGDFVWLAVRETLAKADVYAPIWFRSDGTRQAFVEGFEQ